MSTQKENQFNSVLGKLFAYRTDKLRRAVLKSKPGKPPSFNKNQVERTIKKLQELSISIRLDNLITEDNEKNIYKFEKWRCKGRGDDAKKAFFCDWYEDNIIYKNNVYIIWKRKKCLYVGRTLNGKGRPQDHFSRKWFSNPTSIEIYSTSNWKEIPKLECLFWHRYNPIKNKNKPSIPTKAIPCPMCQITKYIRTEIKGIFNLR